MPCKLSKRLSVVICELIFAAQYCFTGLPLSIHELLRRQANVPGTHPTNGNRTVANACNGTIALSQAGGVFIPADLMNCTCANGAISHNGTLGCESLASPITDIKGSQHGFIQNSSTSGSGQASFNNTQAIFVTPLTSTNPSDAELTTSINDTALLSIVYSNSNILSADTTGIKPWTSMAQWQSSLFSGASLNVGSTCPNVPRGQQNETRAEPESSDTTDAESATGALGTGGDLVIADGTNTAAVAAAAAVAIADAAANFAGLPDIRSSDSCDSSAPLNPAFNITWMGQQTWTPLGFENFSIPIANTTDLLYVAQYGVTIARDDFVDDIDTLQQMVNNGTRPSDSMIQIKTVTNTATFSVIGGQDEIADSAFPGLVALWQWFRCQGGSNELQGFVLKRSDYVPGQAWSQYVQTRILVADLI